MYGVFVAASSEARARGLIRYLVFCAQEIGGLLAETFTHRTFLSKRALLLPLGAAAGASVALAITLYLGPEMYTSKAVLFEGAEPFMRPYLTPPKMTPVEMLLPNVLSSSSLTDIIHSHDLYSIERTRMPIGEVLILMRSDLSVKPGAEQGVLNIQFRYPDPTKAQAIAQEVVSRIIAEHIREFTSSTSVQTEFLEQQVKAASLEWDRLYAQSPAASVELDAARARYESLQVKLADARLLGTLRSTVSQKLEMVDAANLPFEPDISYWMIYAVCIATGAIAGMLYPLIMSRRRNMAIPSGDLA